MRSDTAGYLEGSPEALGTAARTVVAFSKNMNVKPKWLQSNEVTFMFAKWKQFHYPSCMRDKFWRNFPVVPPSNESVESNNLYNIWLNKYL